jgi:glutathione S-transferase
MLLEKAVDFDVTYIDLSKKPAWFLEISPLAKVPLLRVGETVLFESAIINEYLDETFPPALHPVDSLRRAYHRAWIEFASDMLRTQFRLSRTAEDGEFEKEKNLLAEQLVKVEEQIDSEPFFEGDRFSLLDAAYAPLYSRLAEYKAYCDLDLLDGLPRCRTWSSAILDRDSVKNSLPADFTEKHVHRLRGWNSYLGRGIDPSIG